MQPENTTQTTPVVDITQQPVEPKQTNLVTQTPDGTFSMTRLIMVISIVMAVSTWIASFFLIIKKDVFDFIFKFVSLSVTQYAVTKIKHVADKKLNGGTPTTPVTNVNDPKAQYTQEVKKLNG